MFETIPGRGPGPKGPGRPCWEAVEMLENEAPILSIGTPTRRTRYRQFTGHLRYAAEKIWSKPEESLPVLHP